jgi:hypothetical protein
VVGSTTVGVNPAAATHLRLSLPARVASGTAFSLTITSLDAYGNVATGYAGTVRFTSSDTTAGLPANYTFTAQDQGLHSFRSLTLNALGTQSLTATDVGPGSVTGSASVTVVPRAPSKLTAMAASSSEIDLTWSDNSSNETSFLIERSTDGVHWTQVAAVGANVTTYRSTGLSGKTHYYYRVRATSTATNPTVCSAYSRAASATTL